MRTLNPVAWCRHQLSRVPGPDQVGAIINRPVKASLASTCSRAGRDGMASLRSVVDMVQRHCSRNVLLRGVEDECQTGEPGARINVVSATWRPQPVYLLDRTSGQDIH